MNLSEEERNLLMLFAGFLCIAAHDHHHADDCDGEFIEHAEKFIAEFDRNARDMRIEIAPAREPMMERWEQ